MAVAALACRVFLGSTFLLASVPKLAARREFERAVVNYRLLPADAARVVGRGLPWVELVCAMALLVGLFTTVAAAIVAICLIGFAGAAGLNLVRGRIMDCGCSGGAAPRTISWTLVVRNLVLAGGAIFVVVSPPALAMIHTPRWLEPSWVAVSVDAAVAAYVIATAVALLESVLTEGFAVRRLLRPMERGDRT
jgi:uncharacterized membrane protein YphA (DoxX/SURF4 family)